MSEFAEIFQFSYMGFIMVLSGFKLCHKTEIES